MISSPPSASTGSSLYMHLPPVHNSSYIFGAHDTINLKGDFFLTICKSRDNSLAASQADSGVPQKSPESSLFCTTMQKQSFGTGIIAPARSTTFRTGVHLLPIILGLV